MKTETQPSLPVIPSECPTEARCHCGQLMAILKKDGLEVKCKRCKRVTLIPFSAMSTDILSAGSGFGIDGETGHSKMGSFHVES